MSSKFLNISTDNTLGGGSASDEMVSSQKAIKEYVDSQTSGSYADTDLSNLTTTGKSYGASLALPSDNTLDLSLPTSGGTVSAPANGWISIYAVTNGSGVVTLDKTDYYVNISSVAWTPTSQGIATFIPVKSGDVVVVGYANISQWKAFKFIYAEGEI